MELLLLELVFKHPSIDNTYGLTRFFGKSSFLPDKLYETLENLVLCDYLSARETKNTIKYYEVTSKGISIIDKINIEDNLDTFTLLIDPTGFIRRIIFLIENKGNIADVVDSFILSHGRLIILLNSTCGKLPNLTILENVQKKKWRIKEYIRTFGSIESYEKIECEEAENTFQYSAIRLGHLDKPDK